MLWHNPDSARQDLRAEFKAMEHDEPGPLFEAWKEGRTGFPIVDAGMRQLLATGRIHNRVRMICASFLVKDLHVWWWHGARHFMEWLADGDLASNQHNWQWVAGSGTDAAPYFRVFNPTTQGRKFDPDGDYVRRWVDGAAGRAGEPRSTSRRACRATRRRSSTTRRSARRRWRATSGSGRGAVGMRLGRLGQSRADAR